MQALTSDNGAETIIPGSGGSCLSNGLEHQAAKTLAAESSCDSAAGRGWLVQVLRGRPEARGGRRQRSGRAAQAAPGTCWRRARISRQVPSRTDRGCAGRSRSGGAGCCSR